MDTTDVSLPGIAGPENVDNQSLPMTSGEILLSSFIRPKICENVIYGSLKSY